MKKCKYHCDYGDGEYCHYEGESGCWHFETENAMTSELSTNCIVCGEKILLSEMQSDLVPKMCDKCKDAIMFIKRMRSKETVSVVRCKDCKHRPIQPEPGKTGFALEFPDSKCPCQCDDGWYSWYPPDDWFCPRWERT